MFRQQAERQRTRLQVGWPLRVKTLVDRSVALVGLGVAAPFLAPLALAVWATMGRPILFVQERPGRYGHPFKLVKFRTMRAARSGEDLTADADRLTAFGRFMRGFSLDEVPQLINVLAGNMSLVGPRPLLMQYLARYTPEQARRHDVLPGITGWAQVNGRNATSWEERLRLDVEYADNWSLLLDLRILAKTAYKVLARSGIARDGHATMPEFSGNGADKSAP